MASPGVALPATDGEPMDGSEHIQPVAVAGRIHNRDIWPDNENGEEFPAITCLTNNRTILDRFSRYEAEATKYKKRYQDFGLAGLMMIAASVLMGVATALFQSEIPWLVWPSMVFAIFGLAGVAIEIWLIVDKAKSKWISARFAAEWMRAIKAQLYTAAIGAGSKAELEQTAATTVKRHLRALDNALASSHEPYAIFQPREAILLPAAPDMARGGDPEILAQSRSAYMKYRIQYQENFAETEKRRIGNSVRPQNSLSDFSFIAGAALSVVAGALFLFDTGEDMLLSRIVIFATVAAFVFSACHSIWRNASLIDPNIGRYELYADNIKEVRLSPAEDAAGFGEQVRRMETLAMDELQEFCRDAAIISMRI